MRRNTDRRERGTERGGHTARQSTFTMFLSEYMENVERLLCKAKTSARRARDLLDLRLYYAGLTEHEKGLLLAFYSVTSCPSVAVQRLLAALESLLSEALESIRTFYRLREEEEDLFFMRIDSYYWWGLDYHFPKKLTRRDPAGQGVGCDTVPHLLTRVTEALTAAEQCLQSPDPQDHTFEASRRILAGALQLASTAHGCASTLYRISPELCQPERRLLATLTGLLREAASVVRSHRVSTERAADPVGQDEAARAAERPSRQIETLLIEMKSALRTWDGAVQGLLDPHGEPPSSNSVSEGHRGATSSQGGDTAGQGGDGAGQGGDPRGPGGDTAGEGDTSEAVERLLAALEKLLSEALESVRTSYRRRKEREDFFFMRFRSIYSYKGWELDDLFPEELLTMCDPAGQGNGSDTVQRLLTRVTEALTAAEQCLQSPDAQDHTFEASRRILTEALQLASTAHGCASTLYGVSLEQGSLCQPDHRLLATLAGLLRKAASVVRSHRVSMERAADPVGQDMKVWSRYFYYCLPIDFSYLIRQGQGGGTSSQRDASLALQSLLRYPSQLGIEAQLLYGISIPQVTDLRHYYRTLGQGADPVGQGGTSQASRPLLTQLAELESRAQYTVLTFRKLAVDQKRLSAAARRLFKDLAELLTVTESLVTSYRVNKGRGDESVTDQLPLLAGPGGEKQKNPEPTSCYDHGWTAFLKSVWKGQTKFPLLAAVSLVIAGLVVCIVVLWSNQRTEQQIEIKGVQSSAAETGKTGQVLPPCGHSWIWYRGKCNFFSEAKGTWAEAKDACSALDSSLATIDTQKELNFMLRYKGDDNHWIGLRRDDRTQPWTWVNGTKFNNWFTVNDTSECAYLSYGQVKSLECDITNKWICTRGTINSA